MGDQPFDRDGFEAWLAGDPRRKALFDTMWQRIMGPKMDDALDAFVRQGRSRRARLAGGVAIVLALFGGYKALPSVELFLTQPKDYAASDGAVRQIELADGTRLALAGGAEVRVRYTRHGREVELSRGTIFANVTHDESRPFHITAGESQITVLGTRFEVSAKPSLVRVTVESGVVRFGPQGWFKTPVDLTAGQAAVLNGSDLRRAGDVSQPGVARWRSEWVEYHEAPMKQVVADLESVSSLPIRIADEGLANLRVSGRIRLSDPLRQIDNLSAIHDFAVDRRDDAIILSNHKTGS